MAKFKPSLTTAGLRVLSEGLGGKEIKFTSIAIGDGEYSGSTSAITKLVSEKARAAISSVDVKSGEAKVRASIVYADLPVEFKWRELGVFVTDPDTQQEVLYAYANAGSNYDTIGGDQALTEMNVSVKVLVGEAANVTVNVQSGENIYAKKEDLDKIQTNVTNITNIIQQVTGVDPSDPDAAPDGSMVVTLTHSKSGTVHRFTGLEERTGLVPCQFKSTSGYTEGDTATIDGTAYTITLTGADAPETDLFVSGKSIIVDVDTESKTINFKAGGGLTKAKLALADATEDTVFNGRTFYAGSKVLRTGRALATATNVTAAKMFAGTTAYNNQGQLITGNPNVTTATASDILYGKTAYNNYGNRISGTRSEEPILLTQGEILLPSTGNTDTPYTTTITPPAGWVYMTVTLDSSGMNTPTYCGALTKLNTSSSRDNGFNGYLNLYWSISSSNSRIAYAYWNGTSVTIVKVQRHYGTDPLAYRFYGYN